MSDIQQNSIKAWVLAARPKTLSGAVMPVLIGGALALRQTGADFNVTPFVLCVLFALIMASSLVSLISYRTTEQQVAADVSQALEKASFKVTVPAGTKIRYMGLPHEQNPQKQ